MRKFFVLFSCLATTLLCADAQQDQIDATNRQAQKLEDDRLERQRVEDKIQAQKLEDARIERNREDDARYQRKLDDERWDREHGR